MKAISIKQPWASLIAHGIKYIKIVNKMVVKNIGMIYLINIFKLCLFGFA